MGESAERRRQRQRLAPTHAVRVAAESELLATASERSWIGWLVRV